MQSHDIEMILVDLGDIQQILLFFPYPEMAKSIGTIQMGDMYELLCIFVHYNIQTIPSIDAL